MKPQLIDIHTHIIPFVDDGADDWDSAMQMLKDAEANGIEALVATPHILSEDHFKEEADILDKFNQLSEKAKAAGLKIRLFCGSEIFAQPDTTLDHKIATLNANQKYFLIEFPMNSIPKFVPEKLFEFSVDGKVPIIAHPERNLGFQMHPEFIYEYIQRGCLMQINEGSLRGRYGDKAKSLAFQMIDYNYVHFVASDGHKPDRRMVTLSESYDLALDKYGKLQAELLFSKNPLRAIQGEPIEIDEPIPLETETKSGVWQKLKTMINRSGF